MNDSGRTWALVLAAGEGTRLRTLTTTSSGIAVPKQFCSLQGGMSLFDEALERAESAAAGDQVCTVVAESHRQWWEAALASMPRENVIVQPANRGTGNGILLPLLHVMRRDPDARIVVLPSDHHVRDERILQRSLRQAVSGLPKQRPEVILLGVEPDDVDPGLGYIVPGKVDRNGLRTVERFVEKPPVETARALIGEGALWNAFIVVARARALLGLFMKRFPDVVAAMQSCVARDAVDPTEPCAVRQLYSSLPEIDFSRHVAQECESTLRVLTVPACGWSDLGTPARVARVLTRLPAPPAARQLRRNAASCHLNLAAQHARQRLAS
jgi:mannose-1-phosphate guanylyltransferase